MTLYRIAKWNETFERAESRKLKTLTWVAMPVGFNSNGFQLLLDEFGDDAAQIYGAWCALVSIAASCNERGVLGNGQGNPLKLSHIARMTGFRVAIFESLFTWAASKEVGWLEAVPTTETPKIIGKSDGSGESPDDPPTPRGIPPSTASNPTQPNPTQPAAAASCVAAGDLDFEAVDRAAVVEACKRFDGALIKRRIQGIDPDWIWAHCWVGEAILPGFMIDVASKVLERGIGKPKGYVEKALREECQNRGLLLSNAIGSVPTKPQRAATA